ncbi:MAG: enhanced serine sensitivity protein SseB [Oscillospiraceae bacterium]|nr:enhanced serine sensitivity protein SseB [Oscillospiraceae bacterium]
MNLEELLQEAIADNTKRSIFLQTLIRSDIFVMCRKPAESEKNSKRAKLELITVRNAQGAVFIPFFTSYRIMSMFANRYVECYKLNCLRFFELVQNMSAVMNPNYDSREFHSAELKAILNIARSLHIKAISYNELENIRYREPQKSLYQIKQYASKFFTTQPNVERAFLVEMIKGSEKPQILIVVDMMGNTRKLFVGLVRYLYKVKKSNERLFFLSYEQELGKRAASQVEPFYIRNTKRYFQK